MGLLIQKLDLDHLADVNRCDSTFTVAARLVLDAADGIISYRTLPVDPYLKRYPPDPYDPAAYVGSPEKAIYLAYLDGQVVGQIRLGSWWNRFAYVEDIVVDPAHRRQGVGRALLEQAFTWARQGGFPGLMLETQNINVAACRLYERCGMSLGGFDTCLYQGLHPGTREAALYWYKIFQPG